MGGFPEDYRSFLKAFGWLRVRHHEIYGLGDGIPMPLDAVRMTLLERNDSELPEDFIAVYNEGGGNLTCLPSSSSRNAGPVVVWDHEISRRDGPQPIAESFTEWLGRLAAA